MMAIEGRKAGEPQYWLEGVVDAKGLYWEKAKTEYDECSVNCSPSFQLLNFRCFRYNFSMSSGSCHCEQSEAISNIAMRLPRRFAPRNDRKCQRQTISRTF